jgi:hypothetical protein
VPQHEHVMDMKNSSFDRVVGIKVGQDWHLIENATDALAYLRQRWPQPDGPSCLRAIANCEALLAGPGSVEAARASFVVAAMEAGLQFEVHEDEFEFLELQVAMVAEDMARSEEGNSPHDPEDSAPSEGDPASLQHDPQTRFAKHS